MANSWELTFHFNDIKRRLDRYEGMMTRISDAVGLNSNRKNNTQLERVEQITNSIAYAVEPPGRPKVYQRLDAIERSLIELKQACSGINSQLENILRIYADDMRMQKILQERIYHIQENISTLDNTISLPTR